MSLSKKLVVVAVSAMAIVGFSASSAMADTAVHVTNPGPVVLHSGSSILTSSGSAIANCDVTINATVGTSGLASGVTFTIAPGTANCAFITATSTGGKICQDTSGNSYLDANVTVFLAGTPVAANHIVGDINATGDTLTFANAAITPTGTAAIDGTYDIVDPFVIDSTTDAC